ncbi:MAG: glucose 1-dehydrogenase [Pseudomonadales bacterium]
MTFSLEGKRTLITGGTSGIGLAIAKRFAEQGANVIISGRRESGTEIAASVGAHFIRADMMVPTDVERLVQESVKHLGGLDVVINNAGIPGEVGTIADLEMSAFDAPFAVNVRAAYQILKLVPPHMSSGGSIINTASISGTMGEPYVAVYGATKAALLSLTKSAALALAPENIRVNAVNPGYFDTEIWEGGMPEDCMKLEVPLARAGKGPEAAAPYHFLASDDAGYITGSCITVDGGMSAGTSLQTTALLNA